MKALLVDLQRERRRQLRVALQSLNWDIEVIEAASGEEAGLIFARHPVDLLVSSLRLAGISGTELAQRARRRSPGIKVILLGSATDERVMDETAGTPADALLAWPIASEDFLAAVRRCVQTGDTASLAAQGGRPGVPLPEELSLTQRLEALRVELDAQACLLLDGNARELGRAGSLPRSLERDAFTAAVAAALQAVAGISTFLGAGAQSGMLWVLAGRLDVYMARVDSQTWLMAACSAPPPEDKAAQPVRDVSRFQRAAAGLAGRVTAPAEKNQPPPAPPPTGRGENTPVPPDPGLEKLFNRGGRKRMKTKDLNEFWDNQAEETSGGNEAIAGGKAISYEEARRRGLAPGDE